MHIYKIIPIILLLTLSGCTFPLDQQPTANPQLVDEIVSTTLTAQASNSVEMELSATAIPTETFTIASETPSATIANTPTTQNSETPTITVIPTGFKDTLGSPDWKNTLVNGEAFGLDESGYEDENTKIIIDNGAMELSSSSIFGYRGWRLTTKSPTNIYLEAKFDVVNCSNLDEYGLVFRAPDYTSGEGYYVGITCEGKFGVTKWTDTGSKTIIDLTVDPGIETGPDQTNYVGIQMVGSDFYIHINNILIAKFTDDSFEDGGHIGVFISGQGNGNLVVRMDEISYWNLE